jgi:uncharacterized damage-inducible protein DinB
MQPDIGPVCRLHLEFMKWADETMLAALTQVPPDQVGHDLGSSFKSLFGTLNHVYLGELVWIKRVQGNKNARIADLDSPADLSVLGEAWPELHRAWLDWSGSRSNENFQEPLIFSTAGGGESQLPLWQIVLHVVNHGSYHRGQVATMLRQSGIKPPGTDLVTLYRTLRES